MAHTFDVTKARTLLHYLGRATHKLEEREQARKKVRVAINRLKKISSKNVKKDIVFSFIAILCWLLST